MAKKGSSFSQGRLPSLTRTEREVLKLYREGHTPEQIRILRRLKTVRAVQLHLQNIRQKGVRPENLRFSDPGHEGGEGNEGDLRLHGEQFVMRILYRDERYVKRRANANQVYVDGSTVKLHQDSIEVYSCKNFYASDADKCDVRAAEYWQRFFLKLEHDFDVLLVKDRQQNIRRVAAHYERVDSAIGSVAVEQGRQIKIYAADGKLRYVTDRSNFGKNDETLHPDTGKPDRKLIDHHVDVMMMPEVPDLVQVRDALVAIAQMQKQMQATNVQTAAAVQSLAVFLQSQLPKNVQNDVPDFSELRRWC